MVVDGCHLSVLRRIMSVFPLDEVAPVEDVLLQALRETVAPLRTRQEAADLRPLAAVLAQLRRYIDEDGEGLTADQVVTEIRQLCDDTRVDTGRRLKAARLLTKHFSVDRDLFPALVHADTAAALPGTPLSAADTRDSDSRAGLLRHLVSEADTVERLSVLLRLLRRWPVFPAELASDPAKSPLCELCARALELDSGEVGRGLVVAAAAEHAETPALPAAAHERLVELLAEAGAAEASLETALLSRDKEVRRRAIQRAEQALAEATAAAAAAGSSSKESSPDRPERNSSESPDRSPQPWPLSDSILSSLLSAGALPQLVGTALYEPAVTRLLDGGGDAMAAVAQLREAGCDSEAGTLLLQARAARPPSRHSTINAAKQAASKVFSKWLH